MLNWLNKNKEWLFQGGGITILAAVVAVVTWIGSKSIKDATEGERVILITLFVLCTLAVGILFFLVFRAYQAHSSRAILFTRLDSIDKKLKTIEAPRRFDNWDHAKPELKRLITNSFNDFPLTQIDCLGVALHVSWKTVRECLEAYSETHDGDYPKAVINLKVLSPNWRHFAKLGPDWRRRNEAFYRGVTSFLQNVRGDKHLKIKVFDYDYTPNWHGVLINGRHLFRSSCLYRQTEFTVHKNPYVYFRQEENEYSDMQLSEFLHWFRHDAREMKLDDLLREYPDV